MPLGTPLLKYHRMRSHFNASASDPGRQVRLCSGNVPSHTLHIHQGYTPHMRSTKSAHAGATPRQQSTRVARVPIPVHTQLHSDSSLLCAYTNSDVTHTLTTSFSSIQRPISVTARRIARLAYADRFTEPSAVSQIYQRWSRGDE